MNMFWHDDEGVQDESAVAAISVKRLQEEANVILDDKQPTALPRRESYKIRPGRRDESSRLQGQTSAAKAAIFA